MLGRCRFSVAVPRIWNSLPLGLKTNCDTLRGFKNGLETYIYFARTITSQCQSAPQITVISLELWRFINYITYLLTYLLTCRQSTSESWAQFNHDNVTRAEHERMASIQMRTLSDNILHDTARDVREQADASDNAFERRVREMEDCKAKLMENLTKVSVCFFFFLRQY